MSAPGADPLAAIRQRYVSRSQVRRLATLDAERAHDDICDLLEQWDTRESALRALVAQWRENGKLFRTRAIAQLATGTTKGRIAADAYDASADAHFSMADALERLLSGPQP